jgi:hypothetical protein
LISVWTRCLSSVALTWLPNVLILTVHSPGTQGT